MKKYKVIDLQGCGFMDDTEDEPMTEKELRERFWGLAEARTEKYSEFTLDYISDAWEVQFEEIKDDF